MLVIWYSATVWINSCQYPCWPVTHISSHKQQILLSYMWPDVPEKLQNATVEWRGVKHSVESGRDNTLPKDYVCVNTHNVNNVDVVFTVSLNGMRVLYDIKILICPCRNLLYCGCTVLRYCAKRKGCYIEAMKSLVVDGQQKEAHHVDFLVYLSPQLVSLPFSSLIELTQMELVLFLVFGWTVRLISFC